MFILNMLLKSVAGRVLIGAAVAAFLSTAAYWWYDTKHDWEEQGRAECVQLVNEATHKQVVAALARSELRRQELNQELSDLRIQNELARERQRRAEEKLLTFQNSVRTQAEQDETYREWATDPLPDGVADRLRALQDGSN
jgi:hypothetical protein